MRPERLSGGNINEVLRVGDNVLRTAGPWTPTIHRLLHHLRNQGLEWVPEPLGMTADGMEILRFIEGVVPTYPMPDWAWEDSVLVDTARRLRALHDAAAHYIDPDAHWRFPTREPVEVICHNDFAPYNMVFKDGRCVEVIDFDMASPGPRLWDVAYLAYRIVPLTDPANPDGAGLDAATCLERLRVLIDAYGMDFSPRDVLEMTVDRLEDLARFSETMAAERRNPEFRDHAALYLRDMAWIREWIGRVGRP